MSFYEGPVYMAARCQLSFLHNDRGVRTSTIAVVLLLFAQELFSPCAAEATHPSAVVAPVHSASMLRIGTQAVAQAVERAVPIQRDQAVVQEEARRPVTFLIRVQMAFTALALAFGLLHLILFLFLPTLRSNLYFALFLFFHTTALFFDFQHLITGNLWGRRVARAARGDEPD